MSIRLQAKRRPYLKFDLPGIVAVESTVYYVVGEAADVIADEARQRVPKKSGKLALSIKSKNYGKKWRVVVGTNYWRYVEYGTPPHRIRPRKKKALYWDGAPHPMGLVRHPGAEEQPFMRPSLYHRRVIYKLPSGDIRVSKSASRFV
jgi:HK97 gp10 family phage protein